MVEERIMLQTSVLYIFPSIDKNWKPATLMLTENAIVLNAPGSTTRIARIPLTLIADADIKDSSVGKFGKLEKMFAMDFYKGRERILFIISADDKSLKHIRSVLSSLSLSKAKMKVVSPAEDWKTLYIKNIEMEKNPAPADTAGKNWKELYTKNVDLEKKDISDDAFKLGKVFVGDEIKPESTTGTNGEKSFKGKLRILIIESDVRSANRAKSAILGTNPSFDVEIGKDDKEGVEKLASRHFDILLINYKLPSAGGLEFLDNTKSLRREALVVMVADEHNESIAADAFLKGASEYVVKSNDYFKNLPSIIDSVVAKKSWKSLYTKNVELDTKIADVTTAEGAIEIVRAFQKDLLESTGKMDNSVLVIELHNTEEFNKFSKMVNALKNVKIKNIQTLGNTYQITIWAIPESFNIIR